MAMGYKRFRREKKKATRGETGRICSISQHMHIFTLALIYLLRDCNIRFLYASKNIWKMLLLRKSIGNSLMLPTYLSSLQEKQSVTRKKRDNDVAPKPNLVDPSSMLAYLYVVP